MKVLVLEKARVIVSNSDSMHNYFAWPTVARLGDGRIAVAASGYRLSHICPFGKMTLSLSADNGKTYTRPTPIIDTPLDDRDGGICAFGETDVIVTSFTLGVDFYRREYAEENSYHLTPHKDYVLSYLDTVSKADEDKYLGPTYRVSHDNGVTFGEVKRCPIMSPHGPTRLPNGDIIWVGSIYSLEVSHDADDAKSRIRAYKYNPETEEFYEIGTVYFEDGSCKPCEAHALALSDTHIIVHMRAGKGFCIYQSESFDGGVSWSKPIQLNPKGDGAPPFLIKHSSGALVSLYGHRTEPCGIKAMFSLDEGKSWSEGIKIYETPLLGRNSTDLGYPSAIELEDGSLLTVFYNRVDDGSHAEILQMRWSFEV